VKCGARSGYGGQVIAYETTLKGVWERDPVGFFVGRPTPPSPAKAPEAVARKRRSGPRARGRKRASRRLRDAVGDGGLSAFVLLLEVLPEYQGRGIGSELVRRMLALLEGTYMVDLCCDEDLVEFYERFEIRRWVGMGLRNRDTLVE